MSLATQLSLDKLCFLLYRQSLFLVKMDTAQFKTPVNTFPTLENQCWSLLMYRPTLNSLHYKIHLICSVTTLTSIHTAGGRSASWTMRPLAVGRTACFESANQKVLNKGKIASAVTFGAICSVNDSYLDYLINSVARCSRVQIIEIIQIL